MLKLYEALLGTELGQFGQVLHTVLFNGKPVFSWFKAKPFFCKRSPHADEQSSSQNHELEAWGQENPNMWLECFDVSLFYLRIGMASSMLATSAALAVTKDGQSEDKSDTSNPLQCSYVIMSDVWSRWYPRPKSSDPKSIHAMWWLRFLLLATSAGKPPAESS